MSNESWQPDEESLPMSAYEDPRVWLLDETLRDIRNMAARWSAVPETSDCLINGELDNLRQLFHQILQENRNLEELVRHVTGERNQLLESLNKWANRLGTDATDIYARISPDTRIIGMALAVRPGPEME